MTRRIRFGWTEHGGLVAVGRGSVVLTVEVKFNPLSHLHAGLCADTWTNTGRITLGILVASLELTLRWNVIPHWEDGAV